MGSWQETDDTLPLGHLMEGSSRDGLQMFVKDEGN